MDLNLDASMFASWALGSFDGFPAMFTSSEPTGDIGMGSGELGRGGGTTHYLSEDGSRRLPYPGLGNRVACESQRIKLTGGPGWRIRHHEH